MNVLIASIDDIASIESKEPLHHDDVSVSMIMKQCLHKCLENSDITLRDVKVFYSSVFD